MSDFVNWLHSPRGVCKIDLYSTKERQEQKCKVPATDIEESISKGLMVYANQVASDMMVSIMNILKVNTSRNPVPMCIALKRVLLKHIQEIVSDLIDSCMKNLHNITGALMNDCDFISAVKRNLFNHGKQNATDIMEAMLKCLVSAVLRENKEAKSQTSRSHNFKCKNQSLEFSTMKTEVKEDRCKMKTDQYTSLTSADRAGEHALRESLTMWDQHHGHLAVEASTNKEGRREKTRPSIDSLAKELIVSALNLIQYHLTQQAKGRDTLEEDCLGSTMGYLTQSAQHKNNTSGQSAKSLSVTHLESRGAAGPSTSLKEAQQADRQKLDMSNIILSLIQNLLSESAFCGELSEGEKKRSEPKSNKATSLSKREQEQCEDNPDLDFVSGMKQINHQFIDQLIESVMKLCLLMAKYSNHGEALAEVEEKAAMGNNLDYPVGGPGCSHDGAASQNYRDFGGPEVLGNNQSSTRSLQKQLQAVLQWIAASQCKVPMVYFTEDKEGQLQKLTQVSAKAVEKGYSVGDLLHKVMAFAKDRQWDEAVGSTARTQLLDWLLCHL